MGTLDQGKNKKKEKVILETSPTVRYGSEAFYKIHF